MGYDDDHVVFRFTLGGPIINPWGSPNGLALQTLDVYIDQDGNGEGGVAMLPGRNLAFEEGYAWDYAIHAEGWESGIYVPGEETPEKIAGPNEFTILTDPEQQRITIRVPKSLLGEDPGKWWVAAGVMSQDGFSAPGVWRIRNIQPEAAQWVAGGAPAGTTNHTRIFDLVWPDAGLQESWLSDFTASDATQSRLTTADYALVPMLAPLE